MLTWAYPKIIGHRGAGHLAPENTLAAMRVASQHGIQAVEFDVAISQDQIPIVLHDRGIERTSNGLGNADELTYTQLCRFDFGAWHSARFAGEPLPTLHSIAAFTQANGILSNIEIKPQPQRDSLTGRVVAAVAARLWRNSEAKPLLSSFSEEALQAALDVAPQLPRALLFSHRPPVGWLEIMARLQCSSLHVRHEHIDQELIQAANSNGYKIAAWTVNDVARARQLLHWGCAAVFTDAIDTLSTAISLV